MLFQQLYNWIKYKTLPASFLFKNRLYIERDSKHKRIFSNFGLSFRNSKWNNYENSNIKFNFKTVYLKFLFFSLLSAIFIYFIFNFFNFYINFYFLNNLSFLIWISIDTFDYYLSFIVWIFSIFLSLFFNFFYSFFFFNNFSKNTIKNNFETKKNLVSKHDLNWILYIWLTNENNKNSLIFDNLFNFKINQKWWNTYYDFFPKLFKLTYYLNLINEQSSFYFFKTKINNIINSNHSKTHPLLLNFFNNNLDFNNSFNFYSYYLLSNNYSYINKKVSNSLTFLNTANSWNLDTINIELKNYSFLLKTQTGLFFLNSLTFEKFLFLTTNYLETWNLNFFLKNQLNVSKWNRWLYKYSILHRKIIKNSHKLTLSKKLINDGFFNNFSFNKNIWTSELINKNESHPIIPSIFNLNYNNLFKLKNQTNFSNLSIINNNYNEKNTFNLLNFYEKSYFWFIKRFYFLNTLNTNVITSSFNKNTNNLINTIQDSNQNINIIKQYDTLLSYFLKSFHFNLLFFLNMPDLKIVSPLTSKKKIISSTSINKDLYIYFNDNDLLNKDNLNILYWLSLNSSLSTNKTTYFNSILTSKIHSSVIKNIFNLNKNYKTKEINIINYLFLSDIDKMFIKDVNYLLLFY